MGSTAAAITVAGLSVAKGIGEFNASKSNARALKREGEIKIDQRKKEILELVAQQKVGYVDSGVEFEGTPQNVMQDTYNTGWEDIEALRTSYNTQIKNTMKKARAGLLGSIAGAGTSLLSLKN